MPSPSAEGMFLDLPGDARVGHAASSASSLTLATQVYERLRDDIVRGALAPDQKLSFELLKARYGLGMTPMREALQRLSASKLVDTQNRRGFRVASISPAHLNEVIALREIVETALLKDSFQHADLQWEGQVVAAYHSLQRAAEYKFNAGPYTNEWERAHRDFHITLLSRARFPMLQEFHVSLWDHSSRYRNLAYAGRQLTPVVYDGHQQLVDAAMSRDAEGACVLLRRHISVATSHIMGNLFPDVADSQ